ncbi:MAG TPA: tetratricopeptide repeat protein [Thermoanaerobaculia bacterium]|jgi:tetratricopeptide (TPR) repeat protein|nr:tetratricopeptide repeat protein [Thermoanaerobaculia bacterium]
MVRHPVPPRLAATLALAGCLAAGPSTAAGVAPPEPAAALRDAFGQAEQALRAGEMELAESRYRTALLEGWLLKGALAVAAGDLPAARAALLDASTAAVDTRRALSALAVVHLRLGETDQAVAALHTVSARHRDDVATRRLLAQALVAAGHPEQAVAELEEIRATSPHDAELAFTLASGYLRLGRVDAAEPLFAEVQKARPAAATQVLIGRTYRDFGQQPRARAALQQALAMDPAVRRAHYYLGTLALLDADGARLDEAIAELRQELARYPDDRPALLYLGMALVEAQRYEEALPALLDVDRGEHAEAEALYYLGRCQLALGRGPEAAATLRRALALVPVEGVDPRRVQGIEYQLALALRRQGNESEAAAHFAAAAKLSSSLAERSQARLARYLSDKAEPPEMTESAQLALSALTATSFDTWPSPRRDALRREVDDLLARSYLNLGVMQLQAGEPARAVELLQPAVQLAADLAGVQRALGVAAFNAHQFETAIPPLSAALAREPQDGELRRLLAMARLETGAYDAAAKLLADDPQRAGDPALQYAYAMALVRSGQPARAGDVFAELLRDHAEWPELHVLLGQAHAAESDYEAAIASLRYALTLSPAVAEAHLTLGSIYLRQGKLAEAETELRAELVDHADDVQARYQLANVLALEDKGDEAVLLLTTVLERSPNFADGRYLLGKVLLARGDAQAAAATLEAAAQLAPADANVRYQLAQAYQKLGQTELADKAFAAYRELKRGSSGHGASP